ncbi:hypothetical protein PI125_g16909 [Phytophthora idaei]|nr:hypothetical protein PI125_g16909 [Phytophthora idaei]
MTNDEQSTVLASDYIDTGAEFEPTTVMCEHTNCNSARLLTRTPLHSCISCILCMERQRSQ